MDLTDAEMMTRLKVELHRPPMNRWIGVEAVVVSSADNSLTVRLPFRPELGYAEGRNIFHGGAIAALSDIAGYAVVAVAGEGPTPTVTLSLDYVAPAAGEELVAVARLRKRGRSLGRADVEIYAANKLVALARGTFSVT
jgi:uncharacterized protein (TIGR00369 family)